MPVTPAPTIRTSTLMFLCSFGNFRIGVSSIQTGTFLIAWLFAPNGQISRAHVIFAAVLAVILIALGLIVLWRRRSRRLQEQFGPEYKHAVRKYGDARKAEAELAAREKRVRKLEIRPLTQEEQSRFAEVWRKTQ